MINQEQKRESKRESYYIIEQKGALIKRKLMQLITS